MSGGRLIRAKRGTGPSPQPDTSQVGFGTNDVINAEISGARMKTLA